VITKEHLLKIGVAEDKAAQAMEILGAAAEKLYHEDGYAKAMSDLDRAILTHFGVAKRDDEKTSDYFKRAALEKQNEAITRKETELAGKITELESKLTAKPGDEKLIKELNEAKEQIKKIPDLVDEKVSEWKTKHDSIEKEFNSFKTISALQKYIPKLKDGLDDEFVKFKTESVMNKILQTKEIQTTDDGKLLIYDPKNHDRTPADIFLAKEFDSLAYKETRQNGGGASASGGVSGSAGASGLKLDDTMKDNEKYDAIKEYVHTQEGIDKFDPKFTSRMNELLKENKLDKLVVERSAAN
jgi:TPR repeat protein